MKKLTIVIPLREGSSPETTLRSLARQTFSDFDIVVVQDEKGNANWARNCGFMSVRTPFVLFSDDDIDWYPDALHCLLETLHRNPQASYSYGAYVMDDGRIQCRQEFVPALLRARNYISTMSLLRTEDFLGFDEELQRLQDWDLWLTLLERGKVGVYCGCIIFATKLRPGITYGGGIDYDVAERIVRNKHGI